ncbi:hypothetical protein PybrP1_004336 [[Pythium] brassicae (nom. inval.)]|nr:hypothetical protein PybrP1_004336 [[Pythium] brassicae (nom. inval.)]
MAFGSAAQTELPLLQKERLGYQSAPPLMDTAEDALSADEPSTALRVSRRSLLETARESIQDERSRVRMLGWLLIWVFVGIFISEVSQRSAMRMGGYGQQQSASLASREAQQFAARQEIDLLATAASACPSSAKDSAIATANVKTLKPSTWFLGGEDPEIVHTTLPKIASLDELPAHWDWRDFNGTGIGLTTAVLNQMAPKPCGSCWAFGTVSALSDRIRIAKYRKYGKLGPEVVLSPQVLLDCGMRSFGSCNGGDPRYAHKWIHENGIVDWTCNPYIASHPSWFTSSGSCAATQCRQCELSGECKVVPEPKKHFIAEYGTLNATNSDEFQLEAMNEIYHRGPIVVSMYSLTPEYRNYKGGYVLRDATKYPGTTHVVSLVGWGVTDDGLKYWIVRNSDGTGYGDDGFFLAERGTNTFNLETHGAWAVPIV